MTRIFADNIGVVSVYEKDVALPSTIEVNMAGNATVSTLGEVGVLATGFSCFITSFATSKKSQYQLKQSLDHETHIIPFGEAPGQITLKGVTFGFDQINNEGKGGVGVVGGETGADSITPGGYRIGAPAGTAVSITDEEKVAAEAAAKAAVTAAEKTAEDEKTTKDTWEKKKIIEKLKDPDSITHIAEGVTSWVGSFKEPALELKKTILGDENGWFSTLKENVSSAFETVNGALEAGLAVAKKAMALVNKVMALPGAIVDGIMSALGLKAGAADAQKAMTRSKNSQFFPLSFPELNLLFLHMHVGSTARTAANAKLYVTYCGVRYLCAIEAMTFQSNQTSNSINFTMNLIEISKTEYYPATECSIAVNTVGKGPSLLGKLLQTFGGEKVNKVINYKPDLGSGLTGSVSKANVIVGRLDG